MRRIWMPILLLPLVFTPGCFLSRSKVERTLDRDKIAQIEVGKTTKEEVAELLGAPTDIIFSNKQLDPLRTFAYEYVRTVTKSTGFTVILVTFLNADTQRDHVLVFFDDKGVVSSIGVSLFADSVTYEFPFGD